MKKWMKLNGIATFAFVWGALAGEPLRNIRVSAPAEGLLALPVLHMVETQPLKEQGMQIEFVPWKTPEQMRAIILSEKADAVGMHTVGAVTMNSKGVPLRMIGLSLGNVLHVLSSNPEIQTLADLKGKTVAVPFKGEMPDLLFRSVIEKTSNLSAADLTFRYAASSRDAANLLAGGRVEAALVADPHGSILLQKSGKNGIPKLYDAVNLQDAWNADVGKESPLPIAGVAAIGKFSKDEATLKAFWQAYAAAVQWCIKDPAEAALRQDSARNNPAVAAGIKAAAQRSYIAPRTAAEARPQIEQFIQLLREADPQTYGDVQPNSAFYWPSSH